jgi:two-component system cell cycle sensor histidine kinase/response regulator CckA
MPEPSSTIRLLHLEDSLRDTEIIQHILDAAGLSCHVVVTNTRERFQTALATGAFDVVLCDFNLPDLDGLTALRLAKTALPETPVIVVSGTIDADEAVECLKEGATDYLLKDRLERLPSAVTRALEEAKQERQRQAINARLQESEERFRQLAEQSSEAFWFTTLDPEQFVYVSPAAEQIWGLPAERLYHDFQLWLDSIHSDDQGRIRQSWNAFAGGHVGRFEEEYRIVRPDGSTRRVLTSGTQIRNDSGVVTRLSGLTRDVTQQKELEAQFRQAQKMESVGRLAGGVAHDFNNLLTVINGLAQLVLEELDDTNPLRPDLEEILRAGERGAALTRQLLAYSRKQILQPTVLNLDAVVAGMQSLIERLLSADIEVVFAPAQNLAGVRADAGQIAQVLTNLIVNARDAMPHGGRLTIETQNVQMDPDYARKYGVTVQPGPYVMLAVSDTGIGMDAATLKQIFEPFFTTKDPTKGTGLGLSTAYGIIKQSNGLIFVESEVGRGTEFKIYLPQVAEETTRPDAEAPASATGGTETILLVEDNDGLRKLAKRVLESAGYTVVAAGDAAEALSLMASEQSLVHLLLTDVIMPGMNGWSLAQRLGQIRPGIKVLYTSGYTDDALAQHGILNKGTVIVHKPFTATQLLQKVREVLGSTV